MYIVTVITFSVVKNIYLQKIQTNQLFDYWPTIIIKLLYQKKKGDTYLINE